MTRTKNIALALLLALCAEGTVLAMGSRPGNEAKAAKEAPVLKSGDAVVAYYFHGFARCRKCVTMEAYAAEALKSGFPKELKSGKLVWRPTNTDKPGNAHFKKDYKLFTRSLVISVVRDGKQVQWKNLAEIWQLVGNKQAFIEYVQEETRKLLKGHG